MAQFNELTIVSFETAKWLKEIGYKEKNRTTGYAIDAFEVCIVSPIKKQKSDYHNTVVGEFVNEEDASFDGDFKKKTIAAPTVKDALTYICEVGMINLERSVTEWTKYYYKVIINSAIIVMESPVATDVENALKLLVENKNFQKIVTERYGTLKGIGMVK